jgi:predicted dienelactone hydrolase
MRSLEILIAAILLLTFIGFLFRPDTRPRFFTFLPGTGLLLILIHLIVEGYRWQLFLMYALMFASFLLTVKPLVKGQNQPPKRVASRRRTVLRFSLVIVGLLLFILAAALPALFPVFRLRHPSGSFAIGTTRFSLVDSSRAETFTDDTSDRREILVQCWYPAEPDTSAQPESLWHPASEIGKVLFGRIGFLLNYLDLVQTHSYRDAPLYGSQTSYPVLIFSHGYNVFPAQSTILMEELTSHGYIVFSVAHPYEAIATVYADGRVAPVSRRQTRAVEAEDRAASPLYQQYVQTFERPTDAAESEALFRRYLEATPVMNESLRIWTADTRFVLDELERLNSGERQNLFAGRLDMARVGIFGMSFGGATAGQVCAVDRRCRAGINIDGLQRGDLLDNPPTQPFMFMSSEFYFDSNRGVNAPVYERIRNNAYEVMVKGSAHLNFTDFYLISPLLRWGGVVGSIDGERMQQIINAYTLSFFNKHLKGENAPLLDAPSPDYPEVRLRSRAPLAPAV